MQFGPIRTAEPYSRCQLNWSFSTWPKAVRVARHASVNLAGNGPENALSGEKKSSQEIFATTKTATIAMTWPIVTSETEKAMKIIRYRKSPIELSESWKIPEIGNVRNHEIPENETAVLCRYCTYCPLLYCQAMQVESDAFDWHSRFLIGSTPAQSGPLLPSLRVFLLNLPHWLHRKLLFGETYVENVVNTTASRGVLLYISRTPSIKV